MRILGIDPGVQGAIACIETMGPRLVDARRLEIADIDRAAAVVDGEWLIDTVAMWRPDAIAIERQGPMGRPAGASQLCKLAAITGSIIAVLRFGERFSIHYMPPAQWKAAVGLRKADKAAAIARADLLFGPHRAWRHGRHDGPKTLAIARAEAALIAWAVWLRVFAGRENEANNGRPVGAAACT